MRSTLIAMIAAGALPLACGGADTGGDGNIGAAHEALVGPRGVWRFANLNSGMCFDLQNGAFADGAPVIQSNCNRGSSQQWEVVDNGSGSGFSRIQAVGTTFCIQVTGDHQLVVEPCDFFNNRLSQAWVNVFGFQTTNDQPSMQSAFDNQCIDVPSSSTDPQVQLQTFQCNQQANQHFIGLPWIPGS